MKNILFLTGTRADFGKMRMLIKAVQEEAGFENHIFQVRADEFGD